MTSDSTAVSTFEQFDLIPELQNSLQEEGYETPTPVQQQAIPPALEGSDILGCAQTGTGKTAAFALPILNRIASQNSSTVAKRPLALVLAPTRELAIQIGESFSTYGRHVNVSHVLVYGGVGQGQQVQALNSGVHVVIATPGRLLDLMRQEHIFLNRLQVFVLDEADRMLDMGFLPDLKQIIRDLPVRRQSMFFSATMPRKIVKLADRLLHHPVQVHVAPQQAELDLIDQRVIFADHRQKKPLLVQLITAGDVGQAMVFTRTRRGAGFVADYLKRNGIDTAVIHGDKSQNARKQAMTAFRSEKAQVLVATDLAARGIDIDGISHVFNFEIPAEPDQYIHRIGRTGRAGAKGIAISLCSPDERRNLQEIERLIGFELLPDGREPEPVPVVTETTDEQSDERPSGRRNRRRRRGRGSRSENNATPTAEAANAEDPARTRPTAAQRKAARNRRRRRRNADD